MAAASPFFNSLPLAEHGLEWILPPAQIGHPLDDGPAVLVHQSLDQTAEELGDDARAYHKLFDPLVRNADAIARGFLSPLLRIPKNPIAMARFGLRAFPSAQKYLTSNFSGDRAKGMLAGNAAHALQPLDRPLTMGFALIYNVLAHSVGWPYPRGGSQSLVDALASYLKSLGRTNRDRHAGEDLRRPSAREDRPLRSLPASDRRDSRGRAADSLSTQARGLQVRTGRRSRSIGRCRSRSRGRARARHKPDACTLAERSTRSRNRNGEARPESIPTVRG